MNCEWISIEDQAPPTTGDVLVWLKNGYATIGSYSLRGELFDQSGRKKLDATHWMPLPSSPKAPEAK